MIEATTNHTSDAAGQAGELDAIRGRHLCITDTDFDEVANRPVSFDYCEWCGTDMAWPCETILLLNTIDALQARCAAMNNANTPGTDAHDGLLARIEAMAALCGPVVDGPWYVSPARTARDREARVMRGDCTIASIPASFSPGGVFGHNRLAEFIAAHSPDTMRAVWAVVSAGERRRLANRVVWDATERWKQGWEPETEPNPHIVLMAARDELMSAIQAEDAALLALAARLGTS